MDHVFHVGYHKTGTTWLQRRVFPNAEGATPLVDDVVANALVRQLVKGDDFYAEAYRAVLDANGRSLVSYEGLVGAPWGPTDPERIADRLQEAAPEARIVLFTRDRESLERSLYAQYINTGGYLRREDFGGVLHPEYFDVEATIERFQKRFEHVLALRYEDLMADQAAVLAQIGAFADLRLQVPEATQRDNKSLTGWKLEALRRWNRHFRRTQLNPDPTIAVPMAGAMRPILQRMGSRRG